MISFDVPGARFHYRVAGIAIHEGHVLLQQIQGDDYWFLPGGRCEAMEQSTEALVREMREECGEVVSVGRLVWVVENFFKLGTAPQHEIGLYYLMTFRIESPRLDIGRSFHSQEENMTLTFRWFPLEQLPDLRLFPVFLAKGLQSIPETTLHVVNRDER